MQKLFKTRLFFQVVMASLVATLATVGIVAATTTIGTSINTGGTLTVTSTTATSTLSTGGLTVGTNQFVVQQTSGNVGIGTTTPSSRLTIAGVTTEAVLGSELITINGTADQDFSADTLKWTGTGWTVGSNVITHTAGANALTLDNTALSSAPASGATYQITFTVVTTVAGTLTPSIGGVDGTANGQTVGTLTAQTQVITATGAGALTFTPSAAWTGTIDDVSVKQITATPSLITLQNSDGTTGLEMRSGGIGLSNTFVGGGSGQINSTGLYNVAIGNAAFYRNTTGSFNTVVGGIALVNNTTGSNNTVNGYQALGWNTTGSNNTVNGYQAMQNNKTGNDNTAIGKFALNKNTTGSYNTGIGEIALYINTIGSYNTGLGYRSGYNITTGSSNIIIGSYVSAPSATKDQQLNIGNVLYGTGIYGGNSDSSVAVATANIGISTTTPYAKLSIQGTTIASTTVAIRPVASQTGNILDLYTSAGVLNSVINSANKWGIGTTTPATQLQVSSGASATTTVSIGELGLTSSKACVNMNQANGSAGSFYLAGGAIVIENNYCR